MRLGALLVLCGVAIIGGLKFLAWRHSPACELYAYADLMVELQFRDSNGMPVQGITLHVEDPKGNFCYRFPVTNFTPDRMPTSDDNGRLVFHHVSVHNGYTVFPGKKGHADRGATGILLPIPQAR